MHQNAVDYLNRSRKIPRRHRRAIARELSAHLEEAQQELELAGWQAEAAARESLARLGDPDEIADGFVRVYRPAHRRVGLAFALAGVLLAGACGASGSLASATAVRHTANHHLQSVTTFHRPLRHR